MLQQQLAGQPRVAHHLQVQPRGRGHEAGYAHVAGESDAGGQTPVARVLHEALGSRGVAGGVGAEAGVGGVQDRGLGGEGVGVDAAPACEITGEPELTRDGEEVG